MKLISDGEKKTLKAHPASLALRLTAWLCAIVTMAAFVSLAGYIVLRGASHITPNLFRLRSTTDNVSVLPSIANTFKMAALALVISVPTGVGCAIYMAEYAKRDSKVVKAVRLAAQTLSGIPSIIYGIFGSMFFVAALGWRLSIKSGACTLAIMVLPIIITASEEALKATPDSFREGSFGLGAGKLRTVFRVVLPTAIPGILSGIILSIGRISGETAALIFTSGTIAKLSSLSDSGSTLAVQMYTLSTEGLHMDEASAAAVVLLITVALLNFAAGFAAKRLSRLSGKEQE